MSRMNHSTKLLSVVYFGTPDFSARLLKMLDEDKTLPIDIKAVVTQPDKKVGRKQMLTSSAVKQYANDHDISVHYNWNELTKKPADGKIVFDLGIVFAYGKILPAQALGLARYGYWNLHPSLLPKHRGPSPVAGPLLEGEKQTGVTIMQMDKQMDHGPIIAQTPAYIFPVWRRDQLTDHLVELGANLLKQLLHQHAESMDQVPCIEQNHKEASYTSMFKKNDGYIPWQDIQSKDKSIMRRMFRTYQAYYPWPGIWTLINIDDGEKRLKITKVHWEDNVFVIKKVQLEGKREVDYGQFCQAYPKILQ